MVGRPSRHSLSFENEHLQASFLYHFLYFFWMFCFRFELDLLTSSKLIFKGAYCKTSGNFFGSLFQVCVLFSFFALGFLVFVFIFLLFLAIG